MNDDELSRRLRDELHARIDPPDSAPEAVHEHLRRLQTMAPVQARGSAPRPRRLLRDLTALAAAIAVCALLAAGLLIRQSGQPETAGPGPKAGIEAFSRIDATTAWAESGPDLYITRDGGKTWSKGTVPGGKSYGQFTGGMATPRVVVVTPMPTAMASGRPAEPDPTAADTTDSPDSPYLSMFQHLYPDFIDADHGWLVSWELAGGTSSSPVFRLTAWRTADGGKSWTASQLPGTYKGYGVVQFVDASHGWITVVRADASGGAGSGAASPPAMPADTTTILASTDAGASWSVSSSMAAMALATFTSPTEGWGYAATGWTSYPTAVIHTTDAGRTWSTTELPLPAGYEVQGWPEPPVVSGESVQVRLSAVNSSLGGANVSPAMTLSVLTVKSSDGGRTWQAAPGKSIPSAETLDARYLASQSSILGGPAGQPIAVQVMNLTGGVSRLEATFDGGGTWNELSVDGLPATIKAVRWVSPEDAWALASDSQMTFAQDGLLYATHDAGKTWEPLLGAPEWPVSMPPATPNPMSSSDAFESVPPATPERSAGSDVPATAAPSDATAAATNTPGPVMAASSIVDADRMDATTGWVIVSDASANEFLRITRDAGSTWSEPRPLPSNAILGTQFADANHGWLLTATPITLTAATKATVWRTADGGISWQPSTLEFGSISGVSSSLFSTTALHFADAEHGVLFVDYGYADRSSGNICEQVSTSDGGATWSPPESTPCFAEIGFRDRLLGYASPADRSPLLYVTSDGGQSWTAGRLPGGLVPDTGWPVELLHRQTDGTLRAVGLWSGGAGTASVIVSSDGGKTWTKTGDAKGLRTDVAHLVALDDDRLVAGVYPEAGKPAPLGLRSGDGGLSWTDWSPAGLPAAPQTLTFTSATDGWAAVASSGLFVTTDGGANWTRAFAP